MNNSIIVAYYKKIASSEAVVNRIMWIMALKSAAWSLLMRGSSVGLDHFW